MERPKPSAIVPAPLILLLFVVAMAAAGPGIAIALKLEPTDTSTHHIPPLLDCAPSSHAVGAAPSSNLSAAAFRANVLSLLGALPESAAFTPTGFAAAQSGGAVGDDRAFARAFCFGFGARRGSSPGDCLECLSDAAQDVGDGCHGRRRGAVWRGGCFLSYADTNASTAREDAFRGWFYDVFGDDTPAAARGSECLLLANHTAAADCSRCLNESAKVVPAPALKHDGRRMSLVHGMSQAVVVVGYSCYLRVPLFPPTPRWQNYVFGVIWVIDVIGIVLMEVLGLLCCIRIARDFNQA